MEGQERKKFNQGMFFRGNIDKINCLGQRLLNEMTKYDLQERKDHAYTKTLACLARKNFRSASKLFKECVDVVGEESEYILSHLKPAWSRFVGDYKRCKRYIKRQEAASTA